MSTLGTLFETVEDRSLARAYAVLRGEDVSPGLALTSRQRELLRIVASRIGVRRAVSAADLAVTLRCDDREIRGAVHDLRMLFHAPVGSARGGNSGYFLIRTLDEKFDTLRPFLRQAASELRLVRALCSRHELAELTGQLNLNPHDLTPATDPENAHADAPRS